MKLVITSIVTGFLALLPTAILADESSNTNAPYFVGDGEAFDFAVEVKDGKNAFLYLTRKPTNAPLEGANVSLQSADGGSDIKFEPIKDTPGGYRATILNASTLPGQILIQTEDDTDAIETIVPKYKASIPARSDKSQSHGATLLSKATAIAFGSGVGLTLLLGFAAAYVAKRRRNVNLALILAVAMSVPLLCQPNKAFAHGGHAHDGPSLDSGADTGDDVVMPKKSQLLIELRTLQATKEAVPEVIKTYGHIIPKPQLDATITAPQAGFIRGTQGLSLGTKVKRGQLLGTLQAVGQIRIESPIDGEVTEINAVDGSRVDAGGKLLRVTNPSVLWVDAEMFATQLVDLGRVTEVTVAVEGVSETVKARLLNAVSPVSEETRTAKVFLELEGTSATLRMGMLANVYFSLSRDQQAISLPASAILNRAGDRIVFVQTGPETFAARQVSVEDGPVAGTVLITQGVSDGERVVVTGNYQLLMKAK